MSAAILTDPADFLMAGFSETDVAEVIGDLDYLHQNSAWPCSRERTAEMIVESPAALLDFLRAVRADALRNAMIPRSVKERAARGR